MYCVTNAYAYEINTKLIIKEFFVACLIQFASCLEVSIRAEIDAGYYSVTVNNEGLKNIIYISFASV